MEDASWMHNVVQNGIGGTHLGGEGAHVYRDSTDSLRISVALYDFLMHDDHRYRAVVDGYLIPDKVYSDGVAPKNTTYKLTEEAKDYFEENKMGKHYYYPMKYEAKEKADRDARREKIEKERESDNSDD